jgi:hypothetical protein
MASSYSPLLRYSEVNACKALILFGDFNNTSFSESALGLIESPGVWGIIHIVRDIKNIIPK